MSFICTVFGHKWSGCKCIRCGELRNQEHDWENCKCTICGKVQHHFADGICTVCKTAEEFEIEYYDGLKTAVTKAYCSRCKKNTPHLSVRCAQATDPNYGRELQRSCIPCKAAPYCSKCGKHVAVMSTYNEHDGEETVTCRRCGSVLS